jgi:hypothetical protein
MFRALPKALESTIMNVKISSKNNHATLHAKVLEQMIYVSEPTFYFLTQRFAKTEKYKALRKPILLSILCSCVSLLYKKKAVRCTTALLWSKRHAERRYVLPALASDISHFSSIKTS